MNKYLFVYGTLKKGDYNHSLLSTSKYIKELVVEDFTLYDSTYGYPVALEYAFRIIKGELYEVDLYSFKCIELMEKGAGYKLKTLSDVYKEPVNIFYVEPDYLEDYMIEIGSTWPVINSKV